MNEAVTETNRQYDLIVVPGLKLGPGWGMRKDLRERLKAATEQYHANPGARIAICGKWSISYDWEHVVPPVTEHERMQTYLTRRGVNPEDILVEGESKDTMGNVAFLRILLGSYPDLKRLQVICAEPHQQRLEFLFNYFFESHYQVSYLPLEAPHFSADSAANEEQCKADYRRFLASVRPGHVEDVPLPLYEQPYYTLQAA